MYSHAQIIENYSDIVIAPLCGYTRRPFRRALRDIGFKGLYFTEMMNPFEILAKRIKKAVSIEKESPIGIQLFGGYSKGKFRESVFLLKNRFRFDHLDLNMGCPAKQVTGSGGGARLLERMDEARFILEEIRSVWNGSLSVKTRIGWDLSEKDKTLEGLKTLIPFGLDFVTIHFRTVKEGFAGEPHFELYNEFKKELGVFTYLNGGILDRMKLIEVKDRYDPDGIMLARGILENPFLWEGITPGLDQKIEFARKLICYYPLYPLECSMLELRKHLAVLFKGEIYSHRLREQIFKAQTKEEYLRVFDEYLK